VFKSLIRIELLKYKRSIMTWLIFIGAILPSVVAFMFVSNENEIVTWNMLFMNSFAWMNQLALLLIGVLTGYVFTVELHEKSSNILFTYPISRFRFFVSKLFVMLIIVTTVYIIFGITTILLGFISIGMTPSTEILYTFVKADILMIILNFATIPITAFICTLFKEITAGVVTGICYVTSYIVLIDSKLNNFILPCLPTVLVDEYFNDIKFQHINLNNLVIVALVPFILGCVFSAYYYCKTDL
jgi:bacitracin transport system permease protein